MFKPSISLSLRASMEAAMRALMALQSTTKPHEFRGTGITIKPHRYPGAEIRRLNAERGVGSPKRIDPELRATFRKSPRIALARYF